MKMLLLGGSGQVGRAVADEMRSFELIAPARNDADLTRPDTIAAALSARPDVVVNAAAFTAVDEAEATPQPAFAANRDGPGELARLCAAARIPLIHLSTDYVFDGRKTGAYVETDDASPLNVYGDSKLQGEAAVRHSHSRHIILRCSWIFGRHGTNFVRSILARALRGEAIEVVDDQRGCPTPAAAIARTLIRLAETCGGADYPWGTYHFAGRNPVTWFEFADAILKCATPWLATPPALAPISSSAYPARARRPANSVLDCTLIAERLGIRTDPWEGDLVPVVASVASRLNGAP